MNHYLKRGRLTLALSLGVSLSCNKKADIADFERYRDNVCACKDSKCAERVEAEFKDLEGRLEGLGKADKERAVALGMEALSCTADLAGAAMDESMRETEKKFEALMK